MLGDDVNNTKRENFKITKVLFVYFMPQENKFQEKCAVEMNIVESILVCVGRAAGGR